MTNPRYDEQFQRGYAGPPVPPPVDAGPSTPEPAAPERLQDEHPGSPAPARNAPVEESAGVPSPDADGRDIGGVRPFRRNPFAIALLALGVVSMIVGVWLVEQSTKLYTDGYTPTQQAVTQVESQLAAPVLNCGVIAILAWLVLGAFAVAAQRRGA